MLTSLLTNVQHYAYSRTGNDVDLTINHGAPKTGQNQARAPNGTGIAQRSQWQIANLKLTMSLQR